MKKMNIMQMEGLQGGIRSDGPIDPTGGILCAIAIITMANPASTLEQVQWADGIISAFHC